MRKYDIKLIPKIIVFALFLGFCNGLIAAQKLTVVVIDAGHGGDAPGAVGKFAVEKDITLAVALGLGKMIEANFSDVKVYYTRTKDESVDVWKRPKMANKYRADLFISVHCNSSELKRNAPLPKGFETFAMGLHSSAANLAVAQKENEAIFSEKDYEETYEGFNPSSPEAYIIFSLFQNAYLDQSLNFATRLQGQYRDHVPSVDRGVKQAGFLVLRDATMPSVLTEVGFINNPEEEQFMASPEGQEKIITALFNAFKEYKYAVDGFNNQNEILENKPNLEKTVEQPVATTTEPVSIFTETPISQEKTVVSVDSIVTKVLPRIVYKVQFASSGKDIPLDAPEFKNIETIGKYFHQGAYKFTAGEAKSMEEATAIQRKMQNQGYRDAFVVVFKDDERITPTEALKILQEQK
ncbi:MAG: N-acetylmuramoyl-L-alanine amidase [Bacteroidales bacterium]|nr:N-acetylmuramoyl-L-alanine amidase [Bacteroidales bacterium]